MRVIGAGLPRTGTTTLKHMLERLLGGPCYHMRELYQRADVDGPKWMASLDGDLQGLDEIFDGFVAAVDWPTSVLWRELADRYPAALVVLSHRGSSEEWWSSADKTVWQVMRDIKAGQWPEHVEGIHHLMRQRAGFDEDLAEAAARERYDQHVGEVVEAVPQDRLLVWQPSDGWEPLCARLGLPIPDEDAPHSNTSTEFRRRYDEARTDTETG